MVLDIGSVGADSPMLWTKGKELERYIYGLECGCGCLYTRVNVIDRF